ncbi:MAG: hypothetical protein AAF616_06435 [Bacteroidota bacterium]
MPKLFYVLLLITLIACEQKEATNHPFFRFYPDQVTFKEGFVSKFYRHYYPDNANRDAGTEIYYRKYQLVKENQFKVDRYDAAFDLISSSFFQVNEDTLRLLSGFEIQNLTDTVQFSPISPIISMWTEKPMSPYQVEYTYGDQSYLYTEEQVGLKDSIINGSSAKVFSTVASYKALVSDSIVQRNTSKSYYLEDIGIFGSTKKIPDYTEQVELIEQMSVSEFEKRSQHGMHRVGWINPENTLSSDEGFRICGHERAIADYYNSNPDGSYIHGKRALLDTVFTHLDETKLLDQSGRLVFRFVVNCQGKPGRFIAKGYNLDYQLMEFHESTVKHLYSIMVRLQEWRPVVIREEPRDAYFYITFNIKDGKIVDVLP